MTSRRVAVIGVASSAGTHHAGQDQAPAALRAGGFVEQLRASGVTVEDRGDLVHEVFVADAMGIAHLLGLSDTELARLGAGPPMLTDERLALLDTVAGAIAGA